MTESWKKYFDPLTLNELAGVSLRRSVMTESGPVSGTHRSTRHGHSVEFAEHRPYVPGDDLRSVDWKLYAKTDRYFLRHREDETTLICHLLVDTSGSMQFRGHRQAINKFDYAGKVAAGFALAAVNGQDVFSFQTADQPETDLPPGGGELHLQALADALDRTRAEGQAKVSEAMFAAASRLRRQGVAVVISDLFDDPERILRGVDALQMAGHDTLLVQVIDPEEKSLSFEGTTRFEGMEGETPIDFPPDALRDAYHQALERFTQRVAEGCAARGTGFLSLATDQPVGATLARFLAARM